MQNLWTGHEADTFFEHTHTYACTHARTHTHGHAPTLPSTGVKTGLDFQNAQAGMIYHTIKTNIRSVTTALVNTGYI